MKRIVILALAIIAMAANVQAQDKAVKKEWKKKLKAMDPIQLKSLTEERDMLRANYDSATVRINVLTAEVDTMRNQLSRTLNDYATLSERLDKLQAEGGLAQNNSGSGGGYVAKSANGSPAKGVVFRVQIGAFKNVNLKKYLSHTTQNFNGEFNADGTKKYTLGNFPQYKQAKEFKSQLAALGVKQCWIVSYKDGARVDVTQAIAMAGK